MKILLVGEYSRLHNSLKEGLEQLGHQVTIIGLGDHFKNFPVDIPFHNNYQSGISKWIKRIVFKLFKIDLFSKNIQVQFNSVKQHLKGFDIVQLINENTFNTIAEVEQTLLSYIFKHNKQVYLMSCGTDYTSVKYALDKKFKYSILTPYFEKKEPEKAFLYALKFNTEAFKKLHQYIFKNITGVIASDLDYHLPLLGHPKYLGVIPNPINTDILPFNPLKITDRVIIFHGINSSKYYKKGNDFFEAALNQIVKKYPKKVDVIAVSDLPYNQYITSFNKAHIVLDQVYAYDQGFNALEAMAKGKVVFTGAEQEWLDFYNLGEDTIAINALPDVDYLVKKLEWLILNPSKIESISKNARLFIEQHHNYIQVAKQYLNTWHTATN
ncbi:glycosyltransferase [Formosa sp. A9]|uniref:glycosyltransferase n=1 Tax=Formosa sp. A9 TaxID=3442641 RepID=UPI003EB8FCF6